MDSILKQAKTLYPINGHEFFQVPGHDCGRNVVFICLDKGVPEYVLRVSLTGDREEQQYLAETEFVHYLAQNGAPAADVIPSVNGRLVESITVEGRTAYVSLFAYARGKLMYDYGYRYREGAPIEEYFFNTGKVLGAIHRLSKQYVPSHRRPSFFDKYNMEYIGGLIPDSFAELKDAVAARLEQFKELPADAESFGLVHFDFSDGNYHVDIESGDITAFDFDNCMYCWYMFDIANLWWHGEGWSRNQPNGAKRMEYMEHYFNTVLEGYRTETEVSDVLLGKLPLFIDMVLIEYLVDEFECAAREGELPDEEDIGFAAECLIKSIPYVGLGVD